ncbi:hypothetical protein [Nonomuraea sp. NPDC046570]|uniref:hypothetical protein n=1 Tax=Nonomuraea sp. NPDC046570 TaxID=3155255 RepID=UPI0033F7D8D2
MLLSVDVVGYSKGDDHRQGAVQSALIRSLEAAARAAVLDRNGWRVQQSGDGEFAVLPPTEPEPRVVDDFVRHLNRLLGQHNRTTARPDRLRLRVAIHAGVVSEADNGFAGESAVVVGRLLDCAPLRSAIVAAPDANLALIVSDEVFKGTVASGYTTCEPSAFREVAVTVKQYHGRAWIHVPGADVHGLDLATTHDPAPGGAAAPRPTQAVTTEIHGDVHLRGGVIGISNN